tara:strand:- start:108 stop:314 length:207 start_codon:yes stop_codon:yes gene_type:complete
MEWNVNVDGVDKKIELPDGSTSEELLSSLEIHPDGALVLQEGDVLVPIPLKTKLPDADIRIVLVASGG